MAQKKNAGPVISLGRNFLFLYFIIFFHKVQAQNVREVQKLIVLHAILISIELLILTNAFAKLDTLRMVPSKNANRAIIHGCFYNFNLVIYL